MKPPKVERAAGVWALRLRFGNGQRGRFLLPLAGEPEAQRRATQLAALATRLASAGLHSEAAVILRKGAEQTTAAGFAEVEAFALELCSKAGAPEQGLRGMTFRQLGELWTSGELARRYPDHVKVKRSVSDDRLRLARLYETIGDVPLSVCSIEDAERAMSSLPGGRRPATRRHYGQLIAWLLKVAVYPADSSSARRFRSGSCRSQGLAPRSGSSTRPKTQRCCRAPTCRSGCGCCTASWRARAAASQRRSGYAGATST